jgi:hypothetical protein
MSAINNIRKAAAEAFSGNIRSLDLLKKYYDIYPKNSSFLYEEGIVLNDINSIDIVSFNVNFLIVCNNIIKSSVISEYILILDSMQKENRVVEFGLFYKRLTLDNLKLNRYMVAVRNVFFLKFFKMHEMSTKSLILKRVNYDDIEFTATDGDISPEIYVADRFLKIIKFKKYEHVIVLNKRNGVYYLNDNKIINIKYTGGWVNIPAYRKILNHVVNFIIGNIGSLKELNEILYDFIEYAPAEYFFKYEQDKLSNSLEPTDLITNNIKYLFVANVMAKFSTLLK